VQNIRNQQQVQEIRNRNHHCQRFREACSSSRIRRRKLKRQALRNHNLLQEQHHNHKKMQLGRSSCLHRKSACRCRRIRSRRFCQQFYPSIRRHIHNSVLSELRKTSIQLGQACGPKVRNRSWCRS